MRHIINITNQPVQVTFQVAGAQPASIDIEPLSSQQVSEPDGGRTTKIPNVPVAPGALLQMTVNSTGVGSQNVQIPVVAAYGGYGAYSASGTRTPSPATTSHGGADHGNTGHGESHGTESPATTTTPTPTAPASSATTKPTEPPAAPATTTS